MTKPLSRIFDLSGSVYEGLEHRARVPLMLRDIVNRGAVEVTLTFSAATARNMADDQKPSSQAPSKLPHWWGSPTG